MLRRGTTTDTSRKPPIFDHVYTFFARYYDNGDFLIMGRRKTRDNPP